MAVVTLVRSREIPKAARIRKIFPFQMGNTSRLKSRRRQDQGSKWARITIAVLSTIGLIDTGSITLQRWGWLGLTSCPGGAENCDKVLNSPWGTIFQGNSFSIPLSFLGFISYLAILMLAILPLLPGLSESKAEISKRSWWGIFTGSCTMSVFSLVLLGLMIFKIKAFCFFCILSALISLSLLILTLIGGGWDDPAKLFFRGIMLSLIVLLGSLIWSSSLDPSRSESVELVTGIPPMVKSKSTSSQIALAMHLRDRNIVMYSAYWCPHCHDQKEMFGKEGTAKLLVVECASDGLNNQHKLCETKGITGFPSWEIKPGEIESGVRSLRELADLSGYNKPRDF